MNIIKNITLIILISLLIFSPKKVNAEGTLDWFIDIFTDEEIVEKEFHREFDAKTGTQLRIENINGKVNIIPNNDNDKIDIFALITSRRGEKEFKKIKINIDLDEKDMFISTKHIQRNPKVSVAYTIKLPKEVKIRSIETVNGSIKLYKVSGNIAASTVNGSIRIDNVDGTVRAETVNGSIRIKGTNGVKEISTINGSITAEVIEINDDLEISTTNGSVSVWLAEELDATLKASTFNGKVHLNDELSIKIRKSNKRNLKGSFNNGTNRIDIDTTNGSINIYKL